MNKISKKYKKNFAIFLLAEFLTFSMLGVFHIHKFNINEICTYSQKSNSPVTSTDLSKDFFSYCSIHQFNQSLIDYNNAKIELIKFTNICNLNCIDFKDYSPIYKSNLIPRAPPV
ncbi:MAG: hypothetical protein CO128_04250 [Ignavibacteriales bacterium CG_4_9_14_3_um_filter_30_11]|nr:MAG: hypothetical protein CO128_04250 [Ignavibacteriales bacterium CG_4_9_14_3_um_filter_30_11]